MRSNQFKWFHVAGIVLVVGLVIGGGFWWRSWSGEQEVISGDDIINNQEQDLSLFKEVKIQTADTSNWAEYIDERLGFKTKLPIDWEVKPLLGLYEGSDDFVMFKRRGDNDQIVISEFGFSYAWNNATKIDLIKVENDVPTIYYTYKKFKIKKTIRPVIDPENRWDGESRVAYVVYLEDPIGETRSFSISIFSPQIAIENSDLIVHGILDHLEKVEIREYMR